MERTDPTLLGNDVPRGEGPADTTVIRAEIRETRDRMGETIEEIGERLNPNRLKAQVKQDVRDATIGRVENFTNVIRENPIPAAMIGIGLGWLLMNRRQERPRERDTRYLVRTRQQRGLSDVGLSGYADEVEFAGPYAEPSVAYGATWRGREEEGEGGIGESVKDAAGDLADGARRVADTVADQTRVQARRVEDQFYENPLAIATATLALGLAAGLAVPATRAEVELVGETRDRFVDRMRNVARETSEKVTQVAERVIEEGKTAERGGGGARAAI